MQKPRPTVGILHRKPSNQENVDKSSFSSLSLLPQEFNRSLSEFDSIKTIKNGHLIMPDSNPPDSNPPDSNPPKIFLQTGPRNSNVEANSVLVYNTTYGGKMEFPLNKEELTIGRKGTNDIVLSDGKISKLHATIANLDDR